MKRRRFASLAVAGAIVLALVSAPSAQATESCQLTGASMSWGLKASYRDYITGPMAAGSWMASNGATASTDLFYWRGGTGNYNPQSRTGLAGFVGSVTFTAHEGVLATTIQNPELQFVSAKRAFLLLDVSRKQRDGSVLISPGVQFATLDLSDATTTSTDVAELRMSDVPAVLTKAGATAFGGFEEGVALDPLAFELWFPAACAVGVPGATASSSAGTLGVLGWLVFGLGIFAIVALLALFLFRRRAR